MPVWVLEILVIFLLILLNGLLSMAEIAIVSARRNRLEQRADQGDERARMALKLAKDPNSFLSTAQIGITSVGVLTSVFGGASIARNLAVYLNQIEPIAPYSEAISLGLVALLITYFTLVLGELAPKRLALGRPEAIARSVAIPMHRFSRLAAPLVRFLSISTELVLRLLNARPSDEPAVTDEDVKALLEQGAKAGVFEEAEEDMVAGIFRLSDLRVGSLMTPRSQITWIDLDDPLEQNQRKIEQSLHARFPVARGSLDNWIGVVQSKDLLSQLLRGEALELVTNMTEPLVVPESVFALKVLESFKERAVHIALVLDEFGTLQGLVTIFDILEAIVGDIPQLGEPIEEEAVQREDGTWLLDGKLPIEKFKEIFNCSTMPDETSGYYQTLAGFILTYLGHIPKTAEGFEWESLQFLIVDMDGFRIDKVLVTPGKLDADETVR
jgi:putative hemolysin